MIEFKVIAKKGSKAAKDIRTGTKTAIYAGKKTKATELIVNYGLAGEKLEQFFRRFPAARKIPMLNRSIGHSKLSVVRRAAKKDILVPESKTTLLKADDKGDFIEKRIASIGGKGIILARGKGALGRKYYQKFIKNRRYELRVHAFAWIPRNEWRVQKRIGDKKEIAWNYKNGGRFITVKNPTAYGTFVRAMEVSEAILEMLGMAFGAVDFLVDEAHQVYFIEINSAPGLKELSKPIYIDAFNRLKKANLKDVIKFAK